MKKLEKLITKKVSSPETVKGGRLSMSIEMLSDDQQTTETAPTWNGQHYVTDNRPDPNK